MSAPEHVPVLVDHQEGGDIGSHQQADGGRQEQALVPPEQVPDQFKNPGDEEIEQPANHQKDQANDHYLAARRFNSDDLSRGLAAFILGAQIGDFGKYENDQENGNKAAMPR